MSTLSLKWGTLKSWNFSDNEEGKKLLQEYEELGLSLSAMMQKDSERQKEIIYKLIDLCNDPKGIYLDWDGKYVTKQEAKTYVLEYK